MIVCSEIRCSDCLNEFKVDGPRFSVIKEDIHNSYSDEERRMGAHLYQVLVCDDCALWYEERIEISSVAAGWN